MSWRDDAACAETDPDAFFPEIGKSSEPAKSVCAVCPVVAECLRAAVEGNEEFGVWGGLTTSERRPLRAEFVRGTRFRKVASHAAVARRVDAVAVELALSGLVVKLSFDERREAVRQGVARRWSDSEISRRIGVADRTVLRIRGELGLASPLEPGQKVAA